MADKETHDFPKMGQYPAGQVVNLSAMPSANTISRPRGNRTSGAPYPEQTKANRTGIQERLGAKLAPQAALYAPNAAEANDTGRNVRLVPSAIGNRDFYLKRRYGQVLQ